MVQMNKDERVWLCFEMARAQTVHTVQRLWTNRWSVRRVPTILVILKNYIKYKQYGTSLNKNKVSSGRSLLFSYIVIKGEIKEKRLWFQWTTSFRLLQLIAQSIFVRF